MSPHFMFTNVKRERGSLAQLLCTTPPSFRPCPGLGKPTCRLDHWILPMQRGALRQACLAAKMSSSPVS